MNNNQSESDAKSISRVLSTSIKIGGAQLVFMVCGLIRNKAIAIVLGPTGLGLFATLMSIRAMAQSFSGLGVSGSGVRQIAHATIDNDQERLADVALTLKRVSLLSGLAGAALLALFSTPISRMVFQSEDYRREVALIGIVLFISIQTAARRAIVQGARRVGDLSKIMVFSSIGGVAVAAIAILMLGMDGVMPALIGMALVDLVVCWRYARHVGGAPVDTRWRRSCAGAGTLISLGSAFMWNGMLVVGVELATRAMLVSHYDIAATGIFSAAYALSRMFISVVMSAMSADFYPALTGAINEPAKMRHLVIEQIEVGVVMAIPGLLLTMALAPWLIRLLFSPEFADASGLVHWFVLGALLQVISFPAGYILVAQGRTGLLIGSQTTLSIVHLMLIAVCLEYFGIEGVAIAFLIYNIFYLLVFLGLGRQLIGLTASTQTFVLVIGALVALTAVFMASIFTPPLYGAVLGVTWGLVAGVSGLYWLVRKLGPNHRLTLALAWMPFVT